MDKKLFWSATTVLLCGSLASASYAHKKEDIEEFSPFYLAVDTAEESYEVGASLLILQGNSSSDLNQYAVISNHSGSVHNVSTVGDDYNIGFDVFFGYNFENGQDLLLSYTYFNNSNNDVTHCDADSICNSYPNNEKFSDFADASVGTTFNAGDLLFGQRFVLGEQMKLHFAVGLTAAWITNGFNSYYAIDDTNFIFHEHYSQFKGIGPKVGFDGDYQLVESPISLYMGLSVAGLVGKSTASTSEYDDSDNVDHFDGNEQDQFVPNLNVDLGLRYMYEYSEEISGAVLVGYRINEYFDAVRDTVEYGGGDGSVTQIDSTTNYSLNGPYITLSAMF